MKLLIVEDNRFVANHIKSQFSKQHIVDIADTGRDGIHSAETSEYDVIILDLGLPDIKGLEVCRYLRSKRINTPIIILTGNGKTDNTVEMLNAGADDYITKPFNKDVLSARVNSVARRQQRIYHNDEYKIHDLVVNKLQRTVLRSGVYVHLRRKELDILLYLIKNQGRTLSRQMIINNTRQGDREQENNTVDVHVKHLRDKLDTPLHDSVIKTIYGVGYMIEIGKDS